MEIMIIYNIVLYFKNEVYCNQTKQQPIPKYSAVCLLFFFFDSIKPFFLNPESIFYGLSFSISALNSYFVIPPKPRILSVAINLSNQQKFV